MTIPELIVELVKATGEYALDPTPAKLRTCERLLGDLEPRVQIVERRLVEGTETRTWAVTAWRGR